jgi:hypothetical protein
MSGAHLRTIVAGFVLALVFGILGKWVAELLGVNLSTRYVIAGVAALALLLVAIPAIGPYVLYLLGTLLALGVILWWYRRDKATELKRPEASVDSSIREKD